MPAGPSVPASDFERLQRAIQQRDFETLGATAEANALEMHATMREATPPWIIFYRKPRTQIDRVQQLRAEGLPVYLTIDAGPNVKLLFQGSYPRSRNRFSRP